MSKIVWHHTDQYQFYDHYDILLYCCVHVHDHADVDDETGHKVMIIMLQLYLETIEAKLVVEEPVTEAHGEEDAANVEDLAEGKPGVVLAVFGSKVKEVF